MTKYLGIYDTFAQAFPTIATVDVVIKIDGRDARNILGDEKRFDATVTEFARCPDRGCHNGGFQISAVIDTMVKNGEVHKEDGAMCIGYQGKSHLRCTTMFDYCIDIDYKVKPSNTNPAPA